MEEKKGILQKEFRVTYSVWIGQMPGDIRCRSSQEWCSYRTYRREETKKTG